MFAYRVLLAAVLCLAAAGCTSSQLLPAVASFAESAKVAETAFTEHTKTLNESLASEGVRWALASPTRNVLVQNADCTDLADRCRLVVVTPAGHEAPFTPTAGQVTALMASFGAYATSLQGIISAADPVALSKATEAAKTSIVNFAATVESAATLAGADATGFAANAAAVAGPLTQIATIALRRYTDMRKVAAVKAAVLAMDPVLADSVLILERTAVLARQTQVITAGRHFDAVRSVYRRGPVTAKTLADYRSAAILYDIVLQSRPSDVFTKLQAAHRRLAQAVRGRNLSLRELWPLLEELSAEAAKAATAADQLRNLKTGA